MSVLFCDTNCEIWYTEAKELGLDHVIRMPYTLDGKEYYYDLGEHTDFRFFLRPAAGQGRRQDLGPEQGRLPRVLRAGVRGGGGHPVSLLLRQTFGDLRVHGSGRGRAQGKVSRPQIHPLRHQKHLGGGGHLGVLRRQDEAGGQVGRGDPGLFAGVRTRSGLLLRSGRSQSSERGGRISPTAAFLGTMVGGSNPFSPSTGKGRCCPWPRPGAAKKPSTPLFDLYRSGAADDGRDVWIVGADCEEDLDKLCGMVHDLTPERRIHRQIVGPVIAPTAGRTPWASSSTAKRPELFPRAAEVVRRTAGPRGARRGCSVFPAAAGPPIPVASDPGAADLMPCFRLFSFKTRLLGVLTVLCLFGCLCLTGCGGEDPPGFLASVTALTFYDGMRQGPSGR